MKERILNKKFTSAQIIMAGFAGLIALGSFLLTLPWATAQPGGASALDALFTATSSVCVTGLVIHDTASYWSFFGQLVIILLIQIGGMGVVTMVVAIVSFSGRKIGLMQRSAMQESISAPQLGGIVRLTGFILKVTLLIELAGAALLFPSFYAEFGLARGVWYAIFHSVSAFCNAGFDLMGVREPFSSLTAWVGSPVVNLTVMMLIVIGGIGFLTWDDIYRNRLHLKKYRVQSKVILSVTAFLILAPAVYFYLAEFSRSVWDDFTVKEKILGSLFQSVTPRTAGFNSVDLTLFTETGQMVMIILMLIGGSPGSTAGGMKTTTAAVLFASALAIFHRKEDAHMYGRRFAADVIREAAAVFLMYVTLFLAGGMLISRIDGVALTEALFETASAIGTVGLSLGITASLSEVSQLILIALMFFGRVGGLTIIFAALSAPPLNVSRLPQEKITVG